MAGRPWYIKAVDVAHRVTVLGIIGFSGYLGFVTVQTLRFNAKRREIQRAEALAAQEANEASEHQ